MKYTIVVFHCLITGFIITFLSIDDTSKKSSVFYNEI